MHILSIASDPSFSSPFFGLGVAFSFLRFRLSCFEVILCDPASVVAQATSPVRRNIEFDALQLCCATWCSWELMPRFYFKRLVGSDNQLAFCLVRLIQTRSHLVSVTLAFFGADESFLFSSTVAALKQALTCVCGVEATAHEEPNQEARRKIVDQQSSRLPPRGKSEQHDTVKRGSGSDYSCFNSVVGGSGGGLHSSFLRHKHWRWSALGALRDGAAAAEALIEVRLARGFRIVERCGASRSASSTSWGRIRLVKNVHLAETELLGEKSVQACLLSQYSIAWADEPGVFLTELWAEPVWGGDFKQMCSLTQTEDSWALSVLQSFHYFGALCSGGWHLNNTPHKDAGKILSSDAISASSSNSPPLFVPTSLSRLLIRSFHGCVRLRSFEAGIVGESSLEALVSGVQNLAAHYLRLMIESALRDTTDMALEWVAGPAEQEKVEHWANKNGLEVGALANGRWFVVKAKGVAMAAQGSLLLVCMPTNQRLASDSRGLEVHLFEVNRLNIIKQESTVAGIPLMLGEFGVRLCEIHHRYYARSTFVALRAGLSISKSDLENALGRCALSQFADIDLTRLHLRKVDAYMRQCNATSICEASGFDSQRRAEKPRALSWSLFHRQRDWFDDEFEHIVLQLLKPVADTGYYIYIGSESLLDFDRDDAKEDQWEDSDEERRGDGDGDDGDNNYGDGDGDGIGGGAGADRSAIDIDLEHSRGLPPLFVRFECHVAGASRDLIAGDRTLTDSVLSAAEAAHSSGRFVLLLLQFLAVLNV